MDGMEWPLNTTARSASQLRSPWPAIANTEWRTRPTQRWRTSRGEEGMAKAGFNMVRRRSLVPVAVCTQTMPSSLNQSASLVGKLVRPGTKKRALKISSA